MVEPEQVAGIVKSLTQAQRFAVQHARYWEGNSAWNPPGIYLYADKRVRRNLASAGIIRDYLRENNRLTPFGLAVRSALIAALEPKT